MEFNPDELCPCGVPANCRSLAEAGAFPLNGRTAAGLWEGTCIRHSSNRTRGALPPASTECLSLSEGLPPVRFSSAWQNSSLGGKISNGFCLEALALGCSNATLRFDEGSPLGHFRSGSCGRVFPGAEPPNVCAEIWHIDDAPVPIIDFSVETEAVCQSDIIEKSGCVVVHCGLPSVLEPIFRDDRENPKSILCPPGLARHQRWSGDFRDLDSSFCERDCRGRETSQGFGTANFPVTWTMNKISGWRGQQVSPDGTHESAFSIFAVVAENVLARDGSSRT